MIRHTCPGCGAQLEIPEQHAGQNVECGGCGATFQCPAQDAPPVAPEPAAGAQAKKAGAGMALASLLLAILAFACFGIFAAIPAVILGHATLSRIKRGMLPPTQKGMAMTGLALGYVNIALTVVMLFVGLGLLNGFSGIYNSTALNRARTAAFRASCQNNLKQMGLVFKMFANENKGGYPELSGTAGRLAPVTEQVYPEIITDPIIMLCPTVENSQKRRDEREKLVDDESYFYLGYAVTNEEEVALFADAYRERIGRGLSFDDDLPLPEGKGVDGKGKLYRLREGVERLYAENRDADESFTMQSIIPLMIERPDNHMPKGGNVLYMDGHVEFLRYPGQWPMTEKTIGLLLELDAMGE
ncbi:MAG: DUF4190 domain-containing protein [Candidatus Hydrogenedentes bacterium]|nr:DUF4190 domain-containing protein [Candidatus Hydrogenedentota bacterium]